MTKKYKSLVFSLATLCVATALYNGYSYVERSRHTPIETLIILAGQSNMEGTGDVSTLKPSSFSVKEAEDFYDYRRVHIWPRIREFFGNIIYQRTPNFGPEVSVIRQLKQEKKWAGKLILKCALGGTSLVNWSSKSQPTDPTLRSTDPLRQDIYNQCRTAATKLIQLRKPKAITLVWAQGETDATDRLLANNYQRNLTRIFKSFRGDLAPLRPRIYIALLPFNLTSPYAATIRQAQKNISEEDKCIKIINTAHIPVFDGVHYDNEGLMSLGNAIADTIAEPAPLSSSC